MLLKTKLVMVLLELFTKQEIKKLLIAVLANYSQNSLKAKPVSQKPVPKDKSSTATATVWLKQDPDSNS